MTKSPCKKCDDTGLIEQTYCCTCVTKKSPKGK